MKKSYEQPKVTIKFFAIEDVIRTSAPGVGSFNPTWLGDLAKDSGFMPGAIE